MFWLTWKKEIHSWMTISQCMCTKRCVSVGTYNKAICIASVHRGLSSSTLLTYVRILLHIWGEKSGKGATGSNAVATGRFLFCERSRLPDVRLTCDARRPAEINDSKISTALTDWLCHARVRKATGQHAV